mgnify:CR=1 FL=1
MILVIDNYDSFTYNLVQYFGSQNPNIQVYKNDKITIDQIHDINPTKIVLSPGPGKPEDAGVSIDIVKEFCGSIPILGICLGHQAIVVAFGGVVDSASEVMHGKTSTIIHSNSDLFFNVPKFFQGTRYHSLVANKEFFPEELYVTAKTKEGLIMALEHKKYPIFGLQFHPESIVTIYGMQIINNFLKIL